MNHGPPDRPPRRLLNPDHARGFYDEPPDGNAEDGDIDRCYVCRIDDVPMRQSSAFPGEMLCVDEQACVDRIPRIGPPPYPGVSDDEHIELTFQDRRAHGLETCEDV